MKYLPVLLCLFTVSSSTHAQVPETFSHWFYNLSIIDSREKVFDIISKDARFKNKETDTTLHFPSDEQTYYGEIINPDLPAELNKVDSASIVLTWGYINKSYGNHDHTYAGRFKILRIEYFISNSTIIKKIFEQANKELGINYIDKYDTKEGYKGTNGFGTGSEIIYVNNKKHLQQLTILEKTYLNKSKSICLEFSVDKK